ncbi:MAG: amidohydrolase family protein [Candidatus Kapabacteria bacterium]|nr:amidohydrolase family protein [Candidatus Kapabacteria bacterium]
MVLIIAFLLAAVSMTAQTSTTAVDGLRNKRMSTVAYVNCTAVPQPGTRIDSAVIIIRDERIVAIGKGLAVPAGADVRDLHGAWVYAGFVESYCDVQSLMGSGKSTSPPSMMNEEDEDPNTPPAQGAHYWNQAVRPERRITDAFKISNEAALEWQKQGFCAAAVASHDGIFRGSASTVLLRGGPAAKTIISENAYQALAFMKGSSKTPYPSSQMGSIALIRQAFYDADWYGKAQTASSRGTLSTPPEVNISLQALRDALDAKQHFVAETIDEHDILRWQRIAAEFKVSMSFKGSGHEYRRPSILASAKPDIILPLVFPDAPDVRDPVSAREVGLSELIAWYWAADNARIVDSLGCHFAFTTDGLKDRSQFLSRVRLCVERGLDSSKALAAITTEPARMAGISDRVGKIEKGFYANLVITTKPLFAEGSEIRVVVVAGAENVLSRPTEIDTRGHWTFTSSALPAGKPLRISITGTADQPSMEAKRDSTTIPSMIKITGRRAAISLTLDTLGVKGSVRTSIEIDSILISGDLVMADGSVSPFNMRRDSTLKPTPVPPRPIAIARRPLPQISPLGPFGLPSAPKQLNVVLKNATVWTCGPRGILENTDVLLRGGVIAGIGKGLTGDTTIDCTGKHITPGIIDEHSHIAISRGVNEGTHAVTTEVRIGDVVDPDDVNIYRQLAGGVTASHLLHGSANPMGGQLQFIKLRWGADAEGLKVEGAAPTVKFALGENVKQSNWGDKAVVRYPQTRMGVEQIMRDAFRTAREYERELSANDPSKPVRRDLQMDALVEILNSKRNIHCHSYVQSEILMLMRLTEEFGFRVHTFTHILEGYKVAKEMAKHGASASSFSDWWAYKFEVYDAIPQNPAILHENKVLVSINSDDAEMARRLNQEAAKSVKYGDVSEEDAMKFVTINAAKQMAVDTRTGSIEDNKDGDVVVWSGNPLSNMSRVERTFVEGRMYFARDVDAGLRGRDAELRRYLEQEALKAASGGAPTVSGGRGPRRQYECDTDDDEMAGSVSGR